MAWEVLQAQKAKRNVKQMAKNRNQSRKKKKSCLSNTHTFTRSHWQTRTMTLLYEENKLYNVEPYHPAHKAALNELTD